MEIGKRIIKGHVGVIDVPAADIAKDTEELLKQVHELQRREDKLKADFPTATKHVENESSSEDDGGASHGYESESSGVIVELEDCMTPEAKMPTEESSTEVEKNTSNTQTAAEGATSGSSGGENTGTSGD